MICVVVGLPFVFRRSDIPSLAPMLTSNWGRQTTNLFACHSSRGSESRQSNDKHRIGVLGFPQFYGDLHRLSDQD